MRAAIKLQYNTMRSLPIAMLEDSEAVKQNAN
jgi:hypothetical protein